jgi:hypothetical protein
MAAGDASREALPASPATRDRGRMLGLVLLVAAITFLHAPNSYLYPSLNGEESLILFPRIYNYIRLADVFYMPGVWYAMAVPMGLGWMISHLPVEYIPHAMSFTALAGVTLAFGWLALPRHRAVFASDQGRRVFCVVIAVLPLAHYSLISTLMSGHWIMFLLLTLIVLVPLPAAPVGKTLQVVAMGLIVWSHPMCVTLLPVIAYRAWTAESRVDRRCWLALGLLVAAYPILGTYRLNKTGVNLAPATVVGYALTFFAEKVAFESIFGNRLRELVHAQLGPGVFFAYLFAVAAGLALVVWRTRHRIGREQWFYLAYFPYLGLTLSFLYIVLRNHPPEVFLSDGTQLYTFVPKIHFLLLLSYVATLAGLGQHWTTRTTRAAAAGLVVWAVAVALPNQTAYRGSLELGFDVQRMVERLYAEERRVGGRAKVSMSFDQPLRGDWSPTEIWSAQRWRVERKRRPWTFWWLSLVRD